MNTVYGERRRRRRRRKVYSKQSDEDPLSREETCEEAEGNT
jgi:hypothetical protein